MNKTVWIIDDDKSIAEAIEIFLTEAGYHVRTFSDLPKLFIMLETICPNLLIMDVILAEADGREAALKIKANENLHELPIILMSASNQISEEELIEKYRINAYISKPFDLFELVRLVRRLI